MPLTKCKRCDTLFNKVENPICTECEPAELEDHETVREYLNANPNVNAEHIAEATGVDFDCVLRLVDLGSITSVDLSGADVKCGQCGEPAISMSQRLCQQCLSKLDKKMLDAQKSIRLTQENAHIKPTTTTGVRDTLKDKRR